MPSDVLSSGFPVPPQGGAGNLCSVCGRSLPPNTPPELCPRCLLGAGLSSTNHARPEIQQLGHYRLIRRLGSGGMGEVHEADDLETGRRIALKLLSHRLDSPEARRRFLREGRLAASVNHPNSVFVFSTEEFDGVPVISMELMPGGTLEDKVCASGPMTVCDAVDATLQIIDGLEAAQAAGILHRDIKPSNCFLDNGDIVKIGDYGLSISSKGDERESFTGKEGFVGTPAFCPPEHVRGDDLTIRSDIYSVGVTLFYLLSGRPPFIDGDHVRLFAKVLEAPAPFLEEIRPGIPRALAAAVRRCMEKRPQNRFADYQELRNAIAKFGSHGKCPAEPWQRLIAGALDFAIIGLLPLTALRLSVDSIPQGIPGFLIHVAFLYVTVLSSITWFTLFEWKLKKTPGKALLGLEVCTESSSEPAWHTPLRLLARATMFVVLPLIFALSIQAPLRSEPFPSRDVTIKVFDHEFHGTQERVRHESNLGLPTLALWLFGAGLLFAGAQRRTGWIAIHDRITGTRVTCYKSPRSRYPAPSAVPHVASDEVAMLGPFYILDPFDTKEEWFTGFDPVLQRKVWLRKLPVGTIQRSSSHRRLRRIGRLRWLAGGRAETGDNWDAYEYPGGHALLDSAHARVPWRELGMWMADIAQELGTSSDGDFPILRLDHVWITADGRAKLLDFPAPGLEASTNATDESAFWSGFHALLLRDIPPPLPVREFFAKLPTIHDPAAIAGELKLLANMPDAVTPSRRLCIVAMGAAGPFFLGLFLWSWTGTSIETSLLWELATLIFLVAIPAMCFAAFARGGLVLRLAGVVVVDGEGAPVTNTRQAFRSLIAWLPALTSPIIYAVFFTTMEQQSAAAATLISLAAIACLSALLPGRTLQDCLAKTWLVPR